jgi:hypothetical protein
MNVPLKTTLRLSLLRVELQRLARELGPGSASMILLHAERVLGLLRDPENWKANARPRYLRVVRGRWRRGR